MSGIEHDALGLYISVPFCRAKCTFCNFASGVYPQSAMEPYVGALAAQVEQARKWAGARGLVVPERVDTIYLGGGTPSLLPPEQIERLFGALRSGFSVDADAEITLEAAPLQLEPATLAAALEAGVNRVSFGVQSFVEDEARATARTHSGEEALAEFARMRREGVPHVSADVIAGLPGQSSPSWEASLDALCGAARDKTVNHASVYMFELDEDSRLGAEALRGGARFGAGLLPREDAVADWYERACSVLPQAGLAQYEISNFSAPGGASRHNDRYWLRGPYLGFGVDAHSMLLSQDGAGARFAVGDGLADFLAGGGWGDPEPVSRVAALEECWFLGLRRNAGVSLLALREQFGAAAVAAYDSVLAGLADGGLVCPDGDAVRLTARGRLVSNDVFAALLEVDASGCMQNANPAAIEGCAIFGENRSP
jgi:oxygen-independent coproporphyrinogen-3 oxidase